jgi:diguanylate cyclase (GGDEF)-like protein
MRRSESLLNNAKYLAFLLSLIMGISVYLLYKKATEEIFVRKELEDRLRMMSVTDELTGLLNRRGFLNLAIHQHHVADREKKRMCLFYIDLDGMKEINDNYGHAEGDVALIETADILRAVFRKSDIIGRVGGDEFSVLMSGNCDDEVNTIKSRIRNKSEEFHARANKPYSLRVSIGEIPYDPETPIEFNEFFAMADRAMYEQKKSKGQSNESI